MLRCEAQLHERLPVMGKQGLVGSGITYADGYHSAKLGLPRTANPHRPGEPAASHWLKGWNDGNAT
jgi:hypothetical protein